MKPRDQQLLVSILSLLAAWVSEIKAAGQELLGPGDILDLSTLDLVHFNTHSPFDLAQFENSILYLEWFYWW